MNIDDESRCVGRTWREHAILRKAAPSPGLTRRSLLRGAGALGAAAIGVSSAPSSSAGSPLSVTLVFPDGKTLSFIQSAAIDIGTYNGPFVRQQCFRQYATGNGDYRDAFTCYFRPDVSGGRQEIVVEYGTDFDFSTYVSGAGLGRIKTRNGVTPTHILTSYTATISGGGLAAPVAITVPNHFWEARWRWQSAQRPFVRSLADLVAMKAIPPYNLSGIPTGGNPAMPPTVAWKGPMSTGDLHTYIGDPGDRNEIGLITNQQAAYLLTGDAGVAQSMMTDAEALGTMPIWVRDLNTGAIPNLETYPYLCCTNFSANNANTIPLPLNPSPLPANFFALDGAHFPAVAFIPYLLTDDPWHLEGVQATAFAAITITNYFKLNYNIPCMVEPNQTRGFAWQLRDIARTAAFSPASPPSWLTSNTQWRQPLADNVTFCNLYLNDTSTPLTSVFKMGTQAAAFASWEESYVGCVLGWMVWSGLFPPAWAAIANYKAGLLLALGDGTSGWDQRYAAVYRVFVWQANNGVHVTQQANYQINGPGGTPAFGPPPDPATPTSWAQLWADFQAWAPTYVENWTDPSTWTASYGAGNMPRWITWDYASYVRAAATAYQLAGISGFAAMQTYVYDQIKANTTGFIPNYKWAIWTS